MATPSSYWCYRCSRLVVLRPQDAIVCPDCDGGFLQRIDSPPHRFHSPSAIRRRRSRHAASSSPDSHTVVSVGSVAAGRSLQPSGLRRRSRPFASGRSPFNPVVALLSPSSGGTSFGLYYNEGNGSGLRPLPEAILDHLMHSGFERLLDHLAQVELAELGRERGCDNPPASKSAVESMPAVEIVTDHISKDCHCAICTDPFELGTRAREMPCKHIYHQDCILPWLSLHNSCPVCRHQMPAAKDDEPVAAARSDEEETVRLTIWRLPGGGFAVGRFSGGMRGVAEQLPAAYTEMDGPSLNHRRRSAPAATPERLTARGGIRRAVCSFFSFFRHSRSASSSPPPTNSEAIPNGANAIA
ncbi:probable E3 ubiquitin-protein ligase RHC2A [Zingiber officinale]|uniref:RING-type E3 ubiquitin transferase n=1 Tax=Zingiber officinale TaxID=94328 RepID=A0A8J5HQM3_ZINOF|nr:probable E3 ubiquitin-protein ligase RHC2A [Zingiber officinale]KAG6530351.1 hypothetical protein ZIOFF_012579 [Zingiber officinale]